MKLNKITELSRFFSWKPLAASAALAFATSVQAQDHGHLYISAYSQQQDAQLYFDNAPIFETASGYVKTLLLNTNPASRYVGRYDGGITFTPRSTNILRGADYGPNAAAPGTLVYFQITHVDGPPGGAFEFWESTNNFPAFSVLSGSGATNTVKITETNGAPGGDPYGHIHGRRFTATQPGLYRVAFRAWDYSTNGLGGGPKHTPSAPLTIVFQAGFALESVKRTNQVATIRFGTALTHDCTVQASTNLLSTNNWVNISPKLRGTDYFQSVQDIAATNAMKFYRVLVEPFVP